MTKELRQIGGIRQAQKEAGKGAAIFGKVGIGGVRDGSFSLAEAEVAAAVIA